MGYVNMTSIAFTHTNKNQLEAMEENAPFIITKKIK